VGEGRGGVGSWSPWRGGARARAGDSAVAVGSVGVRRKLYTFSKSREQAATAECPAAGKVSPGFPSAAELS
jgi:hypothetical protein